MAPGARTLGATSASALVVANMVGAGVFTTSGFALASIPDPGWVLVAWLVGGGLALAGALSYGALVRRHPVSGGEYTLLSFSLHPLAGFAAGWVSLLAGFTAPIAAAGLAFAAYLSAAARIELPAPAVASVAVLVAGAMHGVRLGPGVAIQNAVVALKVVGLVLFAAYGLAHLSQPISMPAPQSFDLPAFATTLVWISFAYSGWNAAVYLASEVRDPDRNLFRALWTATVGVVVLYLALNTVFLYAAPVEALAGRAEVGAIAAEAVGGSGLRQALGGLVSLALFTSIASMVMVGPRVYAKMARDGFLPQVFAAGSELPRASVALQVGLAIVVIWISGLAELLGYIGFTLGISAAATVAGLIRVRQREGPERVPVPGYPWLPLLFITGTLGAAAFMALRQPWPSLAGLVTIAVGIPIGAWQLRRRRLAGANAHS